MAFVPTNKKSEAFMTRPSGPRDLMTSGSYLGWNGGWLPKACACRVEEEEGWEEKEEGWEDGPDSSSGGQGHPVLHG